MRQDFWLERWERQEIGFHESEPNRLLLEYGDYLNIDRGSRVFVPLCGKALDMVWLRERGYDVTGCDLSPIAIEDFIAEQGLSATHSDAEPFRRWDADGYALLCGDFFNLTPSMLGECHAMYDRAALIALPPDMRRSYAQHLRGLLRSGVHHLLISLEYPQHEMDGPPFSVGAGEVADLFGDFADIRHLAAHDRLEAEPRFRERGLSGLVEHAFCLVWR